MACFVFSFPPRILTCDVRCSAFPVYSTHGYVKPRHPVRLGISRLQRRKSFAMPDNEKSRVLRSEPRYRKGKRGMLWHDCDLSRPRRRFCRCAIYVLISTSCAFEAITVPKRIYKDINIMGRSICTKYINIC